MNVFKTIKDKSISCNLHNLQRYIKFIEYCKKNRTTDKYTEKHHIIPISFGGTDSEENIVLLSARQHYIAHYILAKATSHPKMIKALHRMTYSVSGDCIRNYKINSKFYQYLREQHSKIVGNYSRNTVVAKQIYTGEISRIPQKLFHYYNGILYQALSKNRVDSESTRLKKKAASKKPRVVKQKTKTRSLAASKYSYHTPKEFCETSSEVLKLYPSFTKNTLLVVNKNAIISKTFVRTHVEFKEFIGKTFSEIGFIKIGRKKNESN